MGGGTTSRLNSELASRVHQSNRQLPSEFEYLNDDSIGLELMKEKQMPFSNYIRLGGEFLEEKSRAFENSLTLPLNRTEIIKEFDTYLQNNKNSIQVEMDLRSVSYCPEAEQKMLLECEILQPAITANKRVFIGIVNREIKKFVSKVDLKSRLLFDNAKTLLDKILGESEMEEVLNNLYEGLTRPDRHYEYFTLLKSEEASHLDHIELSYQIFKQNLESYLKLMVYFFEQMSFAYQLLSFEENKSIYQTLKHNIFSWIFKNLEKSDYTIYKYWTNELSRVNRALNLVLSKDKVIELVKDNRSSFYELVSRFQETNTKVEDDIFELKTCPDNYLAYVSIRDKYEVTKRELLSQRVPETFDFWKYLKGHVRILVQEDLARIFQQGRPLFSKRTVLARYNGKKADCYDSIIVDLGIMILYTQSKVYSKKYNMKGTQRTKLFKRFCKIVTPMLGEVGKLTFRKMLKQAESDNLTQTITECEDDYFGGLLDYNNDKKFQPSLSIYLLLCLTILFMNIKISKVELETFNLVQVGSYHSCSRLVLKTLSRKLKNYDFGFHNWEIVTFLENKIPDFLHREEASGKFKVKLRIKEGFHSEETRELIRQGRSREVKLRLREHYQRMSKYLNFSMRQDFSLPEIQDRFDLGSILQDQLFKEQFFTFGGINKAMKERRSKHVIIVCSGFTNIIDDDGEQWKGLLSRTDYSEIYTFKWPSFYSEDFEQVQSLIRALIGKINQRKDLFMLGANIFSPAHVRGLQLNGMEMKEPHHQSIYHMAVLAGKVLAYMIGELNLFETEIVSLVGFSTGSILAYNCLRDLFLMRRSEQVYNLTTIGGMLSSSHFDSEIMKLFPGSYYNVFSLNDRVLKYASNLSDELKNPVGLGPVDFNNGVANDKNIKVYNLDLSDKVRNHCDYLGCLDQIADFINSNELNSYIYKNVNKRKSPKDSKKERQGDNKRERGINGNFVDLK